MASENGFPERPRTGSSMQSESPYTEHEWLSRNPRLGVIFLGWFPEVLRLGSNRIRGQVRLLGLAALVGIVAGLGGDCFLHRHAGRGALCAGRLGRLLPAAPSGR